MLFKQGLFEFDNKLPFYLKCITHETVMGHTGVTQTSNETRHQCLRVILSSMSILILYFLMNYH